MSNRVQSRGSSGPVPVSVHCRLVVGSTDGPNASYDGTNPSSYVLRFLAYSSTASASSPAPRSVPSLSWGCASAVGHREDFLPGSRGWRPVLLEPRSRISASPPGPYRHCPASYVWFWCAAGLCCWHPGQFHVTDSPCMNLHCPSTRLCNGCVLVRCRRHPGQ